MRKRILLVLLVAAGAAWWTGCFRPAIPVTITVRESAVGAGLVAVFRNDSDRYLQVRVTFEDRTLGRTRTEAVAISPYDNAKFGWLEGWTFASGLTMLLEHADYRTLRYEVP